MINMLGCSADKSLLDSQGKVLRFLDLPFDHWAYYHIMEASTPHSHSYDEEDNEVWEGYVVPTAQLGRGPHLVDSQLYYVGDDGYYVRNDSVGVLQFNDLGRFTTGDVRLDAKLTSIIQREADPSVSLYENLRRMYNYIIDDTAIWPFPRSSGKHRLGKYLRFLYDRPAPGELLQLRGRCMRCWPSGWVTRLLLCPEWLQGYRPTWTYGSYRAWLGGNRPNGVIYVCDPQLRGRSVPLPGAITGICL